VIRGSFRRSGRPFIECRLVIPRLRVNRRLMLLVDTGASATCLHPADTILAGIPLDQLEGQYSVQGVGGKSSYFRETANLLFEDDSFLRIYQVDLLIAAPTDTNRELPSLLGRDILNRWRMDYHPTVNRLVWTVHDADHNVERI